MDFGKDKNGVLYLPMRNITDEVNGYQPEYAIHEMDLKKENGVLYLPIYMTMFI